MPGRLAAGLEEGTGEFMEASLALADLLFKVGHADAASQLLLGGGGDTVRLVHGCRGWSFGLPCLTCCMSFKVAQVRLAP